MGKTMLFLCQVSFEKLEKLEKLENWKTRKLSIQIFEKLENYFFSEKFSYKIKSSFLVFVEFQFFIWVLVFQRAEKLEKLLHLAMRTRHNSLVM